MTFDEIADRLAELEEEILETTTQVSAEKCKLDSRCGDLYIGNEFIYSVTPRRLDCFGGFGYVGSKFVLPLGRFGCIYSAANARVAATIEASK